MKFQNPFTLLRRWCRDRAIAKLKRGIRADHARHAAEAQAEQLYARVKASFLKAECDAVGIEGVQTKAGEWRYGGTILTPAGTLYGIFVTREQTVITVRL